MSEEIQSVKSFAKAAAIKATAVQQEENDLVLLGVPWTAIEDCVDAVSSPEKRLAIGRLCCGKLISKNQVRESLF